MSCMSFPPLLSMSESQGAPRLAGEDGSGETLGPPGPAQCMTIRNLFKAPPKRHRVPSPTGLARKQQRSSPAEGAGVFGFSAAAQTGPARGPGGDQPDRGCLVLRALADLRRDLLPEIRREIRQETQPALSEHIASLVASQVGVLSAGFERILDSKLQGVERRLAAVEVQPSQPNADVESLSQRLQSLQFATNEASSDILARVERLELRDNQNSLMMYGLPEEGDEQGLHLRRHVSALLVSTASQHGFAASFVSSAKRFGSARVGSSRPRPVMVCRQTEGKKHAAFKARKSLLEQKIRVDDYLTRAQMTERKERAPLMAHLRTKFPQLIPHRRGPRIFIIKEGQGARPHKDTDASQAHDSQPAQAPQPPSAASAPPRHPPRPAASRPAQTPA